MNRSFFKHISLFLVLVMSLSFSQSSISTALNNFYIGNEILFYDKDARAVQCSTGSVTSAPVSQDAATNEKIIFQYFLGKNFSPVQAAGAVGNISVETGGTFDPNINQNGGGPGRGIVQWEAGPDGRWVQLVQFARNQNRSERDLMLQLDFIWYEMKGTENAAYKLFVKTTTVESATEVFMSKYERPGVPALPERIKAAQSAFAKYSTLNGIGGTASGGGCSGSTIFGGSIVQIAEAEFAKNIVERPARCDEGNPSISGTCGPEIDKYTDNTLEYWCADFVSWVYKTAGKPFTGGLSGGWRIASVDSLRAWFEKNGTFFTNGTPQPGDVVIYSYSHTDIVVSVDVAGGKMVTIGGNTGVGDVQNGNGVGKQTKSINSPSIVGFGRLK